MLRSLWRSIDRFSFQHFQYVINELQKIKVVDQNNRELVVDLLQSVVEIVTYGYRQDPQIFECFMERQVLADFVRILKISQDSKIEGPLLQAISNKINRDTLCLLVNVQGDVVVSFPFYTEAPRFAQHEEKIIQTAILL
ncbi:hypothetical protein JHK84_027488 [Glycine max]|nr:hypothetical protein JHK84_027488 [Glycine max]